MESRATPASRRPVRPPAVPRAEAARGPVAPERLQASSWQRTLTRQPGQRRGCQGAECGVERHSEQADRHDVGEHLVGPQCLLRAGRARCRARSDFRPSPPRPPAQARARARGAGRRRSTVVPRAGRWCGSDNDGHASACPHNPGGPPPEGNDYLDKSCNLNVDSIEVFFDATDPMLIAYDARCPAKAGGDSGHRDDDVAVRVGRCCSA